MRSHDGKRWLIGARRSDLWFDQHRTIAALGRLDFIVIPIVTTLIILVAIFTNRTQHEEAWEKSSGFIILIILFGILLIMCFGVLHYLDRRSVKYFKKLPVYLIESDGNRRRTIDDSFELRALLIDEVVRDRAFLWKYRTRIDLMIPPARDYRDRGTNPERRDDELAARDSFLHEAFQFLTVLGVSSQRVEEHFTALRASVRDEEERIIRTCVDSLRQSIAQTEQELPENRRRLSDLVSFSGKVLAEK